MTKPDEAKRLTTSADYLDRPDAGLGDIVTVVGGLFDGWTGKIVSSDGIWRTIEVA